MNRRYFLALSAGVSVGTMFPAIGQEQNPPIPVIDTHIHLFDTNRPQGVPWPTKNDGILFQPALPDRYRRISKPFGIVGAIAVEASPLPEDNQWVLEAASKDEIIVGTVGNLEVGKPAFGRQLERFQANPLFRGIRYGNLWGQDITAQVENTKFVSDIRSLNEAGLVLDTANPNPALLSAIVKLTDRVPDLKVVIDHLPQMIIPLDKAKQKVYEADLRRLGERTKVYLKISEVLHKVDGQIPTSLDFYRAGLDELYGIFGEDRLLYGSDWPNSDQWLPFGDGMKLVRDYFMAKGRPVAEKYFWKNSVAAYHWVKRNGTQPG